ncbi:hybrid sensor histidine kinase/response regulator [Massilia antarctica]|uniref:hybrid sensor histidine kinase/response regulator n=1 Tax=Massilia antarctica TaxID=2765360 RepID=UPI0006BB9071|nr:ATP-binding protein [Massilia sp. H27-R4]MCY0914202.1 ATP-binding protein [Massilia sp. H27-R4]
MLERSLPSPEDLFAQAACGLMLTDVAGNILRANQTLAAWLGFTEAEMTAGMRLQDLLSVGGRLFHQTHCAPLLQLQGSVSEVQVDLVRKDRTRVPALLNIARRRVGDGLMDQVAIFIANDRRAYERELLRARSAAEAALAAQKGAEAKLRRANEQLSLADRRKDEFLATLAHELRNPLAPMRSGVDLLKMQLPDHAPQRRMVDMFDRQLRQMSHLVDDLMEVARISQGKLVLRTEPVSLGDIVQGAVGDMQAQIAAARHTLSITLPAQPLMAQGDPTRLTQMLVNLLTNACKYTPAGGRITLDLRDDASAAVIAVSDSGIGIPREALESVFEMFSQLEPALQRAHGGLGIGLALVKGLVELHGGTIRADSPGPGQGSTFTVRLPLVEQAPAMPRTPAAPPAGAPLQVLVVDDNRDAAQMLKAMLDLHGYPTALAYCGEEAAGYLREHEAQACVMDIGLPDINGYELARRIRAMPLARQPILIALTGWGQPSDIDAALAAGFDHHLAKPVEFATLQHLLAEVAPL